MKEIITKLYDWFGWCFHEYDRWSGITKGRDSWGDYVVPIQSKICKKCDKIKIRRVRRA
jgi:hypothetical protein